MEITELAAQTGRQTPLLALAPLTLIQGLLTALADQIELGFSPRHGHIKQTHLLRQTSQLQFCKILLIRQRIHGNAQLIRRIGVFHRYRHIRHILDADSLGPAKDNSRAAILTVEGLVHIEQEDILELQPLTLMNGHEANSVLRRRHWHTG